MMQTKWPLCRSGAFNVTDFGTNQKPICDFLFVINTNLPSILHRNCWQSVEKEVMVFTTLHVMQTRYSDENSVRLSIRLSVCPFVTRVNCDKTEERYVQIFIPYKDNLA